jgi:hypothetical protein
VTPPEAELLLPDDAVLEELLELLVPALDEVPLELDELDDELLELEVPLLAAGADATVLPAPEGFEAKVDEVPDEAGVDAAAEALPCGAALGVLAVGVPPAVMVPEAMFPAALPDAVGPPATIAPLPKLFTCAEAPAT